MTGPPVVVRRRPGILPAIVGLASLANGAALVIHIGGGLELPALLATTWTTAIIAVAAAVATATPSARATIVPLVTVGLAVGLVATLGYDASKALLSQLDTSPYNPFEATRTFGLLLLGSGADAGSVVLAGWTFHFMNGCTFGVAFAALFARGGAVSMRRGLVSGIAWALFLETFQLVLYPNWLRIGPLDEFRQISFLSHVVFGTFLGLLIPAGLRRAHARQ